MSRTYKLFGFRVSSSKCLIPCLCITFVMGWYLASLPLNSEKDDTFIERKIPQKIKAQSSQTIRKLSETKVPKLAIIVPFRDRFEELIQFVPHMHNFLNKQGIPFHIFVIQQTDSYRFNRAMLINVGFLYTKNDYDYLAMHDVDLLPLNDNLTYSYPVSGPLHISSPETHPKYHYATFVGGILLITMEHYESVNGMSNNYWGWGLEDDEFYVRLKDVGLKVTRPSNITTGTENTFKHVHDKSYRKRDMRKCFNQREVTRRRDRVTGLSTVEYTLHSVHRLTVDDLPLTVVNVELKCDRDATPWCQCPDNNGRSNGNKSKKDLGKGV